MKNLMIVISPDGSLEPTTIDVAPGDKVAVSSPDVDATFCVSDSRIFGDTRFKVRSGKTVRLTVQRDAIQIPFSLSAEISSTTTGEGQVGIQAEEGTGKVGGRG